MGRTEKKKVLARQLGYSKLTAVSDTIKGFDVKIHKRNDVSHPSMLQCAMLGLHLMLKGHFTQYGHSFQEKTYISN